MNDKRLDPEVRMKVATEVTQVQHTIAMSGDICVFAYDQHGNKKFVDSWDPSESIEQKDALTRTAARLIEETDPDNTPNFYSVVQSLDTRLRIALSTDSVDDLERIVAELRGWV